MIESNLLNINCNDALGNDLVDWRTPMRVQVPLQCRRIRELNKSTEKVELSLRRGSSPVSDQIQLEGPRELAEGHVTNCVSSDVVQYVFQRAELDPRIAFRVDRNRGVSGAGTKSGPKDLSDVVAWPKSLTSCEPSTETEPTKRLANGKAIAYMASGVSSACTSARSSPLASPTGPMTSRNGPMASPNGPLRVPVAMPREKAGVHAVSTDWTLDGGLMLQGVLDAASGLTEFTLEPLIEKPKYGFGSI